MNWKTILQWLPTFTLMAGVGCGRASSNSESLQDSVTVNLKTKTYTSSNPYGAATTHTTADSIASGALFFQSLGTNGRSCFTCHDVNDGWTVTPPHIQQRFNATNGTDPIFRTVDGSNSPNADVSTVDARRQAYSMLLTKGVIRVGIAVSPIAEFELVGVDDPYGYASAAELSLFRRALPSTNLQFLSTVMWDGRETFPNRTIAWDLSDQANGATLGHAQGTTPLTQAQRDQIVQFESSLFTAQTQDNEAGDLGSQGATGGPVPLSKQNFYLGINDVLGGDPTGAAFNPVVFTLFGPWAKSNGNSVQQLARASIARGEAVFNTKQFQISGVRGLNDALGQASITGTCTSCHDTPNSGNHSLSLPVDVGISDASRRTPDMPLYTLRNKTTGEIFQTTDPGRALITGLWKDLNCFKGPVLRGLAARAPYFHNGSAAGLDDVVRFYNDRFNIGLTDSQKSDLSAFLSAL